MLDTLRNTAQDREATLTVKAVGPSPTEPSKLADVRWSPLPGEKPEDVPPNPMLHDAKIATEPYRSVDPKIVDAMKSSVTGPHDEPRLIISRLPALNSRDLSIQDWRRPPEEITAFGYLLETNLADHSKMTPADFIAIGAVIRIVNTATDGTVSWSPTGLEGKPSRLAATSKRDPVEALRVAVSDYKTDQIARFSRDRHEGSPELQITLQGFDACVCAALANGDVLTALRLTQAANIFLPEYPTASADAVGRNILNLKNAFAMYPIDLKHRADAVLATLGQPPLENIGSVRTLVTLKEEALARLNEKASAERNGWYARQLSSSPDAVRAAHSPTAVVETHITKSKPSWKDIESELELDASEVVQAQAANIIAAELARRIHPENTVMAHVGTFVARELGHEDRRDGPTYYGPNEYKSITPQFPDLIGSKKADVIQRPTPEQRGNYLADPNNLDVGAFLRFFKAPKEFFGQNGEAAALSPAVATAMIDRFTRGLQFLSVIVYSNEGGMKKNDTLLALMQNHFGIDPQNNNIANAYDQLKAIKPTSMGPALIDKTYIEIGTTYNPTREADLQTVGQLQNMMLASIPLETSNGKESARHELQARIDALTQQLEPLTKANQAVVDAGKRVEELERAETKVKETGVKPAITLKKDPSLFPNREAKEEAVKAAGEAVRQALIAQKQAESSLQEVKKGFGAGNTADRTIEKLEVQLKKLESLLAESLST